MTTTVRVISVLLACLLVSACSGSGGAPVGVPSTGPSALDERATCVRAVPLLDRAADMIKTFGAAADVTTLDGDAYERLAVNLASLEIVAAPSLRPHIANVATVAGDMNRIVDGRTASVTIDSARVGGAGVAVAEACRQYAIK